MQAGRLNTHRKRKDQTGGASKIKNFGTDFNHCKNNGVSVSEIRVTKERSSFFAWQPISFGEGFLYPLTMVRRRRSWRFLV